MIRRSLGGAVLVAGALLASGCSSATTIAAVDAALAERYLEPLRSADIGFTVDNTCHLDLPSLPDEPWHLEVQIKVNADTERVADVLEAEDVVLVRDRDPMVVQQERGKPQLGWNGVLESADDGSLLGLTHNNVTSGSFAEAGAWAEVCRSAG